MLVLSRVLKTSIGVPAEWSIQELCWLNVKFDAKISISNVLSKQVEDFFQILWPSQNVITLQEKNIFALFPSATFAKEITESFRKIETRINDLLVNVIISIASWLYLA